MDFGEVDWVVGGGVEMGEERGGWWLGGGRVVWWIWGERGVWWIVVGEWCFVEFKVGWDEELVEWYLF